jgi:holliday junction DNA helicase RuvA
LKDKAVVSDAAAARLAGVDGASPAAAQDALSALLNLGYGRSQAAAAVAASVAALGEGAPAAKLILRSLKELTR